MRVARGPFGKKGFVVNSVDQQPFVTERNDNSIGAVAIKTDEKARRLLKFKHNGTACLCSVVRWFGAVSGHPGQEWDNSGYQGLAAQAKPSILSASFGISPLSSTILRLSQLTTSAVNLPQPYLMLCILWYASRHWYLYRRIYASLDLCSIVLCYCNLPAA